MATMTVNPDAAWPVEFNRSLALPQLNPLHRLTTRTDWVPRAPATGDPVWCFDPGSLASDRIRVQKDCDTTDSRPWVPLSGSGTLQPQIQ
ncbi:hypothetical protein MFU01_41750 [Myxococcus fulvus]|uniref:Uncharacterized protein n=1 Tax=Myxococcus fulvus TaxID=33 RepID=A0A511T741_MYXFU|nr:hypothetical protein MFU01_41750 [Myxococcus fulvus]